MPKHCSTRIVLKNAEILTMFILLIMVIGIPTFAGLAYAGSRKKSEPVVVISTAYSVSYSNVVRPESYRRVVDGDRTRFNQSRAPIVQVNNSSDNCNYDDGYVLPNAPVFVPGINHDGYLDMSNGHK